jgi:hypothetical protein
LENEQVIERMNRKITFTKNQRYLATTLQFASAFQNSGNCGVFDIEPPELIFTNFKVNKIYEAEVKLVNKSKHIQRIKIAPLQRKEFVVADVRYPTT